MEGIEVPYSLLIPLNYSQKFVKLRHNSQICPHFLSDSSKKWQFVFEMPLCQQTEIRRNESCGFVMVK
jgi:hypothetical protein